MGTILTPECSCNTEFPDLYVGLGMMYVENHCDVPTPCFHCGTMFVRNILKQNHRCPTCKKKVEPLGEIITNEDDEGRDVVFSWDMSSGDGTDEVSFKKYELLDRKYKCPKCGKDELVFFCSGMWD